MSKTPRYWYAQKKLKHVTGFLTQPEKDELKRLAKLQDKSLSRYVTIILQQHIAQNKPVN